jgi:hypothetical protein
MVQEGVAWEDLLHSPRRLSYQGKWSLDRLGGAENLSLLGDRQAQHLLEIWVSIVHINDSRNSWSTCQHQIFSASFLQEHKLIHQTQLGFDSP